MTSVVRTRVESVNKKLSVSVYKMVSKVEILSTAGITPLPIVVASLIFLTTRQNKS